MKKLFWLAIALWWLSGCSTLGVSPWERDLLSEEAMTFGSQPARDAYDQHIYFSKESSSGGLGFSGGGCGCN